MLCIYDDNIKIYLRDSIASFSSHSKRGELIGESSKVVLRELLSESLIFAFFFYKKFIVYTRRAKIKSEK